MSDGKPGGIKNTASSFARRVVVEWVVDGFKYVLSATGKYVMGLVGLSLFYGLGVSVDIFPSPIETSNPQNGRVSGPNNEVETPLNAGSISYARDGTEAGELGESLHLAILPRLKDVPANLKDLEIQYGLTNLASTTGSAQSVTLNWALRRLDGDWLQCEQSGLQFYSRQTLQREIARTINNSLTASERMGNFDAHEMEWLRHLARGLCDWWMWRAKRRKRRSWSLGFGFDG